MADYYSSNRATTANSKDFILTDEAEQHFPSEGLYIGSLSGNYMVGINGQTSGPYNWMQLQQLVQQGQLTRQSYVWKQGMAQWDSAGNVAELAALFNGGMPPMPGM